MLLVGVISRVGVRGRGPPPRCGALAEAEADAEISKDSRGAWGRFLASGSTKIGFPTGTMVVAPFGCRNDRGSGAERAAADCGAESVGRLWVADLSRTVPDDLPMLLALGPSGVILDEREAVLTSLVKLLRGLVFVCIRSDWPSFCFGVPP